MNLRVVSLLGRGIWTWVRVSFVVALSAFFGVLTAALLHEVSSFVYIVLGYAALIGAASGFGAAVGVALFRVKRRLAWLAAVLGAFVAIAAGHFLDAQGVSGKSFLYAI